jgi:hypothetical protein
MFSARLSTASRSRTEQLEVTVSAQMSPEEAVRKFFDCYSNGGH